MFVELFAPPSNTFLIATALQFRPDR